MDRALPVVLLTLSACAAPPGPPAPEVGLWAGVFEFDSPSDATAEFGSEYRFQPLAWQVRPVLGGQVTAEGAVYLHGGARVDLWLSERWRLAPFVSLGFYEEGEGLDLGSDLEFRSGAELSCRILPGQRLGISFYHLSNASIDERNPGSESIALTWSVDLAPGPARNSGRKK